MPQGIRGGWVGLIMVVPGGSTFSLSKHAEHSNTFRSSIANVGMTHRPCCVSVTATITLSRVWQWLGHAVTSLLDSQPLENAALSSSLSDLPQWLAHCGQRLQCTGLHTWHPLTSFNQPPFLRSIYWDYLQTSGDEGTPLKLYSRLVTAAGFAPKEKKIIF